ncbi:MAG TPA: hypothetical protein VLA43_06845 [Longimicrobiales bacterium]|nr:hypothetical protein [Longimicrobiales bacterium]
MPPISPTDLRSDVGSKAGLALALVAAAAWAALAPPERSLGDGIRVVYLHVAATMAGLTCLYGVGLVGAVAAFQPLGLAETRLRSVWIAGLAAFALGFVLSLVSATVSWGGIFWAEPRVRASLGVGAVGLVALAVHGSLGAGRVRHLVWPVSALLAFVLLGSAPLYVHPDHPVQRTTPLGIRAAFIGISICLLVASLCLARLLHGAEAGHRSDPD